MATRQISTIIQHLRRAALGHDGAGITDGQLLESFIARKDDDTFGAILHRHGPMVLGVCGRILRNHHDSEDAFQAVFLVLARKAASIRPREQLANWLHGVAYRTALKARALRAKTHGRERQMAQMPEPETVPKDDWSDLQPLLDEELTRLPEIYRLPLVLCDLESKSIKEATRQLGWPQGTLAGRLARARKLLAKRLTQRGIVLSGGALAAVLSEKAALAFVPLSLAASTTTAAVAVAAGQTAATSLVSAKVAVLMKGAMKTMMLTKFKTLTVVLLAFGLVAFSGSMLARLNTAAAQQVNPDERNKPAIPKPEKSPKEIADQRLYGEWIHEEEEITVSFIFGPDKAVRRITNDGSDKKGTYSVDWNKHPVHLDLKFDSEPASSTHRTIMEFVEPGRLQIEMGGSQETRPKKFSVCAEFTKHESPNAGTEQAKNDAADDLAIAEFYRRSDRFGWACYYYKLVEYRYPDTDFAEKATRGLKELRLHRERHMDGSEGWKSPARSVQPRPAPKELPAPPRNLDAPPPAGRPLDELKEQVKTFERRLDSFEAKDKPQPSTKPTHQAPSSNAEIEELRQQMMDLERRLEALEAKTKKEKDAKRKPAKVSKYQIEEKEPSRVGDVQILGRENLDRFIRRELPFYPGAIISYPDLLEGEKKLVDFGVTIEIEHPEIDEPYKNILIRVKNK